MLGFFSSAFSSSSGSSSSLPFSASSVFSSPALSSSPFSPSSSSSGSSTDSVASFTSTSATGTTGADCKFFATGIFVTAAILTIDGSVVTRTIVFLALAPTLAINFILTTLLKTPAFLGGTKATIFDFEFSILVMISVISSSGSI